VILRRMILHRHDVVTSTSDLVKEMADAGAPEWTTVVARSQTEGRGRMSRRWHSPRGNLFVSVLLRPDILPSELPRMSILTALAVFTALDGGNVPLNLKWPNDILLDNRKIAGVLLEGRTRNDRVEFVVAGMGINLTLDRSSFPADLRDKIASFHEVDAELTIDDLLSRLEIGLDKYSSSFRGAAWDEARSEFINHSDLERGYISPDANGSLRGRPVDMTVDGCLVIDTGKGLVTVRSDGLADGVS